MVITLMLVKALLANSKSLYPCKKYFMDVCAYMFSFRGKAVPENCSLSKPLVMVETHDLFK